MDNKGGYVFSSFTAIIILSILILVIITLTNANYYKHNWEKNKCNPGVIPIAGYIKSEPGLTPGEFTRKNFKECYSQISKEVADEASVEYKNSIGDTEKLFNTHGNVLSSIESKITNIKNTSGGIFSYILNKIINIILPIIKTFIDLKNINSKVNTILHTLAYYSYTVVYSFRAFFGSFLEAVIGFLIILSTTIAALWIIPFGFIPATAATIFFATISVPLTMIAVGLKDLDIKHKNIPRKPKKHGKRHGCFQKNTLINNIPISKLNIRDKIGENNYVTGLFKFSTNAQDVYKLKGIIVTSHHKIWFKYDWINVEDHPDAVKIDYYEPFVYCINTTQKVFEINEMRFLDWDDIGETAKEKIIKKERSFDRFMIGGFSISTLIKMNDNTEKKIDKILVNDILADNNKVLGIVLLEPFNIYEYGLNGKSIFASLNVFRFNNELLDPHKNTHKRKCVYHLITEKRNFTINDVIFHDYDYALEKYL